MTDEALPVCFLSRISQNQYACQAHWIWTFILIIACFLLTVGITIWMIRASYFIRTEREQALLEDILLAENEDTCVICGSLVPTKKTKADNAKHRKTNPEWELPYAKICSVCHLIGLVKVWVIFQFFFLAVGGVFWYFGLSSAISIICCCIILLYAILLFGRFIYVIRSVSGARRSALFCCGGDMRRRVDMLKQLDRDIQENASLSASALASVELKSSINSEGMRILHRIPPKHCQKVMSLLKEDEQLLWSETMTTKRYFRNNYDALFSVALLAYIMLLFVGFIIWSFVETESLNVLLPVINCLTVWLPWAMDHYPKTRMSFVLTDRRVIAVNPGLFFFNLVSTSIYYAKMKVVILQRLEPNSKEGRVLWMRDQENVFSRLPYVSDIEIVGLIIRNNHPHHIRPEIEEEQIEEQTTTTTRDIEVESPQSQQYSFNNNNHYGRNNNNDNNLFGLGEFSKPNGLDLQSSVKYQRYARFLQPGFIFILHVAGAIFFLSTSTKMVILMLVFGVWNSFAWFFIMNIMYKKYVYLQSIQQLTLHLVSPTSLPSSIQHHQQQPV